MCSLPGLPTPGSEIHVLVTRVNLNPNYGLVELWINMNDGKEHVYEQMRKEIQIPERKFCGLEGKPGEYCLVCISDTWHRAQIVSIENGSYTVFLIDQAQPYKATNEALAWGHRRYFHLSPETESCILANVLSTEEKWPEKATQFLNSLPGKKFKGLAQHLLLPDRIIVLDIPAVSKNMCEVGVAREISGDEFKCLVLKCLNIPKADTFEACSITQKQNLNVSNQLENYSQYFYPELLTNTFESVKVTEVIDPQNIFCELLIFSKALKILLEQIHQNYEGSSDFGEAQPQTCGAPCASKGADGRWRRSVLRQNLVTSDGAVEVMHVDEGRTEVVPIRNIRALHGKFLRMPVVTYLCSLNGVKDDGTGWTEDQTDYLKSLICTWTLVARFDHHNLPQNKYDVTLYAVNAACINDCFLKKTGLFVPSSFMRSDKDRHFVQKNLCLDALQDETLTRIKSLQDNGEINDVANDDKTDKSLQHSYSVIQSSGHLSTHCPSDVEDGLDALTVGSSVNVRISCIESLQKFWCQLAESEGRLEVLMQDLQTHYASAHPQPLVESTYIARNPDNGMWYRARITADHHSPVVQVRFIDYGLTKNIPLQDLCLIDPTFLKLNAQVFQCRLFSPAPTGLPAFMCTGGALAEFQEFVDLAASPNKLKCVIKAVICDEEGLPLKVVDIQTPSESASKLLAQKCADAEAHVKDPPQIPSDAYTCSTDNTDLGTKEDVLITSSENVNNFYCQLKRNSYLVDKVTENIKQLVSHPLRTDGPIGLNTICLVKYTDNQWYRGQVIEMSPELKVHCVDYGDTLEVNKSDICLLPPEATVARSIPVLAIPLGLSDIPDDVPEEVNHWFANTAVGKTWTISVVGKKGAEGKLIVELSQGSLNVNVMVREKIANITGQKMTSVIRWSNQQLSTSPKQARVSARNNLTPEDTDLSPSTGIPKLNSPQTSTESHGSDGVCSRDGPKTNLQYKSHVSAAEDQKTLDEGRKANSAATLQTSPPSCQERNLNVCVYKKPNLFKDKLEEVYASFIDGPHYFWCQYSNTEVLNKVSRIAQEVGQVKQDLMFPETLVPGSPCLALFSDDQWYRAQVIDRTDETVHVVFVDYGNESEVTITDVRALNSSLLEDAPQAFLCSLEGFDKSKGFWDDAVHDYFHSLLVDKRLQVTVFNVEDQSEINLPQYEVKIHCDDVVVHKVMQKYWTPNNKEHAEAKRPPTEQSEQPHGTEVNVNMCLYKEPELVKNILEVYASCIVGPHYFWCQFANTDRLSKVSILAQEVGQAYENVTIPGTLGPGSPCLALFSTDKQWYRALVMDRTDHTVHVVFIDYGNESEVNIKDVKPLPLSLLEEIPQAFLCSLNGFDESRGSWNDEVFDEFYNLLADKPLLIKVDNMKNNSEIAVPQFEVQIKSEGMLVNKLVEKYWTELDTDHPVAERGIHKKLGP